MKSNVKFVRLLKAFVFLAAVIFFSMFSFGQQSKPASGTMQVGLARVDITPDGPIRLTGYGSREKSESKGIIHRLEAKAIAFGSDNEHPSILITVDLLGISERLTSKLVSDLSKKTGIDAAQVVICASHTHGAPEIGNAMNILQYRDGNFSDSLLSLDQLIHIAKYTEVLSRKLEEVALAALKNRTPALVAWGQGQASFAANRRTEGGPVDPALPIMRITNTDGKLRAVLLNYACHGTTLEGNVNEVHGDWIGEAKRLIEINHPGVMALISIGCGADANPKPRGKMEDVNQHAREISDNVDKLLGSQLQPLTSPPTGRIKWVRVPFSKIPSVSDLIRLTQDTATTGQAYYARLALDRLARGGIIPSALNYPVQVWGFENKMAMVNLGGEVVVDYSTRLKNELGAEMLWINAYSNDVPCYIASDRVIKEGGYEVESSMFFYDKPSPLALGAENIIVDAVHEIIPPAFKKERDTANHQEIVSSGNDGSFTLPASLAEAIGPNVKYMREWKAFGWFNTDNRAVWKVNIEKGGKYAVYLKWSVSDNEAGKSFVLTAGKKTIKGKVGKTGSWFTYREEKIGTIQLKPGVQEVAMGSNTNVNKGPMFDLLDITLVPVK